MCKHLQVAHVFEEEHHTAEYGVSPCWRSLVYQINQIGTGAKVNLEVKENIRNTHTHSLYACVAVQLH
jgi:hypothetical protein